MRLLITTDNFLPRLDGISMFLKEIIPKLSCKVSVAAPLFPGVLPNMGIPLTLFPLGNIRFGDYPLANVDKKKLRKEIQKADVVFNQGIGPIGMRAIRIAEKLKKPAVSYVHSIEWELGARSVAFGDFLVRALIKIIARVCYNKCSRILTSSNYVKNELKSIGVRTPIQIVPLGVNASEFTPPKSKNQAKKKIGYRKEHFIIGYAGRIAREKDLPTLYRAFELLKIPLARLLIMGEGLTEELHPFDKRAKMMGGKFPITPWLQAMDVFVLPSLTETSSLGTMEAMACGIPAIATKVGNIPSYVKHCRNGYLIDQGDYVSLAKRIQFLHDNPEKIRQMGKVARETIIRMFSWEKTAEKINSVLGGINE